MSEDPYAEVAAVPDRIAIEHEVLAKWNETGVFAELRARNEGGPPFSFLDGPITANNPMAVHHAWGRTLKDIVQRYHAMQGRDLRWQSGFDCQGLWVEVEVERSLGFDSKREIERYGVDRFARACRDRVNTFAARITAQSQRLGMWMDWDQSYYTMTDTNISYIWMFLKKCHEQGWLYEGHRVMPWCHRCGTSLSQHELADSYAELRHPSVFLQLPLLEGDEHLGVWTTTPWTLPADVAVAVHPEARYVLVEVDGRMVWVAENRVTAFPGAGATVRSVGGHDLVGRAYRPPFADVPAQRGVVHRVVAWADVSLDEGTGLVHVAPGCGAEDFALAATEGLAVLSPLDDEGNYVAGYGWLDGRHVVDVNDDILAALDAEQLVLAAGELTHRYPVCWRCATPLVQRVVDEWFLACDEVREPMRQAARGVQWHPQQFALRMDEWLRNMGDWCISRKRYWGLPLPFYRCGARHLTVVGSKEELLVRAVRGADDLVELHRPWIDTVVIACATCGGDAARVTDVGDCWLDAGIVAFSTLDWGGEGHADWEHWFPAEVVCEMHEQIRLWFYSLLFMSVVLDGRAPYRHVLAYSRVNDDAGREMHRSSGNAIWFDDAVEAAGADTMRWLYAAQPPARDLRFGYQAMQEVDRRFLTFWNSYAFYVTYANLDRYLPAPDVKDAGPRPEHLTELDRWALARLARLVEECRDALDAFDVPGVTAAFDRFSSDLSNWYLRRSRHRFWRARNDPGKQAAYETLWFCLVTALRCVAPVMPFITDHMWANLVGGVLSGAPRSVHLEAYPVALPQFEDDELVAAMDEARRVAELGRAARAAVGMRRRQPLLTLHAVSADGAARGRVERLAGLVADECNVKSVLVSSEADDVAITEIVPNYARLGPRVRGDLARIAELVRSGDVRRHAAGYTVGQWELDEDELVVRTRARAGYAVVEGGGWVVAVDLALTPELELEGRARDLVRSIQQARKDGGLDVAARIHVTYPADAEDVVAVHHDWIAEQTLALSLEPGEALNLRQ